MVVMQALSALHNSFSFTINAFKINVLRKILNKVKT